MFQPPLALSSPVGQSTANLPLGERWGPLHKDLDRCVESASMARVPRSDPLEYDPATEAEQEPADPFADRTGRLDHDAALAREADRASRDSPRTPGEVDEASLFGEEADLGASAQGSTSPNPRDRGLRLDFSQVQGLEQEHRASKRAGAARIDDAAFLSRSQQAALDRAKAVPRTSLPNLIERDERSVGTRVVHESKRYWLYLALGVAIPALVVAAGVFGLSRYRAAKLEREIQELRGSETLHRQLDEARQKQIAR